MSRKVLGLVLTALVAWLVPACGDSDDEGGPNRTGSNECCKMRQICRNCICSNLQIDVGVQDRVGPCIDALESFHGVGCTACEENKCLAGC